MSNSCQNSSLSFIEGNMTINHWRRSADWAGSREGSKVDGKFHDGIAEDGGHHVCSQIRTWWLSKYFLHPKFYVHCLHCLHCLHRTAETVGAVQAWNVVWDVQFCVETKM